MPTASRSAICCTSLRQLAHFFEDAGIAHGDLQPGNITVSGHGRTLQLIDYDGLYVEALGELGSPELGHRNFQHPQRGHVQPFGRGLDRFSLISLTVALMALSHDPSLWESSGSDMEAILFRAQDFANPLRSSLFSTLAGVPVIAREVRQLAAICQSSIHAIPSLEDFLNGHNLPGPLPKFPPAHRSSLRPAYLPGYPVLDASRFAECLPFVGEKVEIVGRITRLHRSRTRWGDEYLFLNFGHWEENIVKINLWNEGLRVLRNPPNESWEGRYVSAIGLMEPPWSSPQHRYQHLAITVTQGGQLHQISEQEARERLAGPRPGGQRGQAPPPGPSMTSASPPWYLDPAPPASLRPPKRRSRLVARLLSWLR